MDPRAIRILRLIVGIVDAFCEGFREAIAQGIEIHQTAISDDDIPVLTDIIDRKQLHAWVLRATEYCATI